MNIDIWMDVRCPFCYIEKKNFELALNNFKYKDKVILIWHSFELDPELKNDIEIDAQEPRPHRNKISKEQAATMQRATTLGKEIGFDFNFEKLVKANSFNAHRLIQFAKSGGVAGEAFESLFKNYFSEGKNIDDLDTLLAIGISLGMNKKKLKDVLESDAFSREVRQDETKAKNLKITEAPFFIINKKQAIPGEQSPQNILNTLNASWKDFKKQKPYILTEGDSYYSTERKN